MTMQEYREKLKENEKRNEEMGELFKNGYTIKELAEKYNLSVTYTRAIMVKIGLYKANKRRTKEEISSEIEMDTLLTSSMIKSRIAKEFPIDKTFRIKEYRIECNKKIFTKYRYYKVKNHYKHCIQLIELNKKETENGIVLVEKGEYRRTTPSYISLYLMLRNGVKISD